MPFSVNLGQHRDAFTFHVRPSEAQRSNPSAAACEHGTLQNTSTYYCSTSTAHCKPADAAGDSTMPPTTRRQASSSNVTNIPAAKASKATCTVAAQTRNKSALYTFVGSCWLCTCCTAVHVLDSVCAQQAIRLFRIPCSGCTALHSTALHLHCPAAHLP